MPTTTTTTPSRDNRRSRRGWPHGAAQDDESCDEFPEWQPPSAALPRRRDGVHISPPFVPACVCLFSPSTPTHRATGRRRTEGIATCKLRRSPPKRRRHVPLDFLSPVQIPTLRSIPRIPQCPRPREQARIRGPARSVAGPRLAKPRDNRRLTTQHAGRAGKLKVRLRQRLGRMHRRHCALLSTSGGTPAEKRMGPTNFKRGARGGVSLGRGPCHAMPCAPSVLPRTGQPAVPSGVCAWQTRMTLAWPVMT